MKRCLILCSLIITTLILTWSTLAAGRGGGQVLRWAAVEHISIGNPPPPPRAQPPPMAIPRSPPPPPAAPSGSNP
ncbi:hypothetical protein AAG906_014096 [Vitis piasezkii]